MRKKKISPLLLGLFLLACSCLPALCTQTAAAEGPAASIIIEEAETQPVPLADAPSGLLLPSASGTKTKTNDRAAIDYSNTADGYIMVRFTGSTNKRLKVQVASPRTTYTYDLTAGSWATFPLSDGNGTYKATVLENASGTKYAIVLSGSFEVKLSSEFAPFLRPNQYVNYGGAKNTLAKASALASGASDALAKVDSVYNFVINGLTYDTQKAATVKSGYLPVLDNVLAAGKGICFDYGALMAGMLRSQGVPCKLVVGYAGQAYHAWVNVWTKESGWVNGAIYFDGSSWQRMDPTFASSGGSSPDIMQYIGNGSNYKVKYLY